MKDGELGASDGLGMKVSVFLDILRTFGGWPCPHTVGGAGWSCRVNKQAPNHEPAPNSQLRAPEADSPEFRFSLPLHPHSIPARQGALFLH